MNKKKHMTSTDPPRRKIARGSILFYLSGLVLSASIGGGFAWYYSGGPSHSTREICLRIARAKGKMNPDSCQTPIQGIPQLPFVSYLGVPFPQRYVFQGGLTLASVLAAIAFFDLFQARKLEIEHRISQAIDGGASSPSDLADNAAQSNVCQPPPKSSKSSPRAPLDRPIVIQRFNLVQKLNPVQLVAGLMACATLATLAWVSLTVSAMLHTTATITFFLSAILQLGINLFIQRQSFRIVEAELGRSSDSLYRSLMSGDTSPTLCKPTGPDWRVKSWTSNCETRLKIWCLAIIFLSGAIWGVATIILRAQKVCELCTAPPEEWIAIAALVTAVISYAQDIQRYCGGEPPYSHSCPGLKDLAAGGDNGDIGPDSGDYTGIEGP